MRPQVVVPVAEPIAVLEADRSALSKRNDPVVDLQPVADLTSGDATDRVPLQEGLADGLGNAPAEVGQPGDVGAFDRKGVDDGVMSEVPGRGDRYRPGALDLAHLARFGGTAKVGVMVDPKVYDRTGGAAAITNSLVAGQVYQGIGSVGLGRLPSTVPPRLSEPLLKVCLDTTEQNGALVGR